MGTRFGRVRTAADTAAPAPSAPSEPPRTVSARATVHQAVAATSLAGAMSSVMKLGDTARSSAAISPVRRPCTAVPSTLVMKTHNAPSRGTT